MHTTTRAEQFTPQWSGFVHFYTPQSGLDPDCLQIHLCLSCPNSCSLTKKFCDLDYHYIFWLICIGGHLLRKVNWNFIHVLRYLDLRHWQSKICNKIHGLLERDLDYNLDHAESLSLSDSSLRSIPSLVIEGLCERTKHLDIILFSTRHSVVIYFRYSIYWWKVSVWF